VDVYIHFPICVHGIWDNTGTTLQLPSNYRGFFSEFRELCNVLKVFRSFHSPVMPIKKNCCTVPKKQLNWQVGYHGFDVEELYKQLIIAFQFQLKSDIYFT
jgi:hypothetical protein